MRVFFTALAICLITLSAAWADTIIPGGAVSGTWDPAGSPYIVQGDIWISLGATLTIEPGVDIRFDAETGLETTSGTLLAHGTSGDPIVFTSNEANPQPGDWDGIHLYGSSHHCEITYCSLSYGSVFYAMSGNPITLTDCFLDFGVSLFEADINLLRCEIEADFSATGAGTITFDDGHITGLVYKSEGSGSLYITNSTVDGNVEYGSNGSLYITDCEVSGSIDIDAEEARAYLTGGTLNGPISSVGDMEFDDCTVNNSIAIDDPNNETINLDITNSTLNGPIQVGYCNLEISDCVLNGSIELIASRSASIHENTLQGSVSGALSALASQLSIVGNTLNGGGIDITAYFGEHWGKVAQNLLIDSPSSAIRLTDESGSSAANIWVENNTIYGAGGNGIEINQSLAYSTDSYVINNIVSNCTGFGVAITGVPPIDVSYNNIWNALLGEYMGVTPGSGSIEVDPLFVDPAGGDFHLQSIHASYHGGAWLPDANHSQCIDAGNLYSDYSLEPTPNGGRINMGAYGNTSEASLSSSYNINIDLTYLSGSPVPASGGNIYFDVFIENLDIMAANFDAWLQATYCWSGEPVTLVLRNFPDFQPGWTVNRPGMYYPIPAGWIAGQYYIEGIVGEHPIHPWDASAFYIEKEWTADDAGVAPYPVPGAPNPFGEPDEFRGHHPIKTELIGAYPNPFNPSTVISYTLQDASFTTLAVYDITGREVTRLVSGWRDAGAHEVIFDGSGMASGVYFYRLAAGDLIASGKLVLIE